MAKKTKETNIDLFYMNMDKNDKKHKRAEKKTAPKKKKAVKKLNNKKETIDDDEVFNFNTEFVLGITDKESKKKDKAKKTSKKDKKKKTKTDKKRKTKNNTKKEKIQDDTESLELRDNSEYKKRTSSKNFEKKNTQQNKVKTKKKNKKSNKKFKILLKFIKWTILIGIIIAAIIFIMTSPIFNLKQITVEGNGLVSSEEIISLSELKVDNNIFDNTKVKLINNIKRNPYIESVEIKRDLPDKISIKINERIPAYSIQVASGYAYIDKQGYILEIAENKPELPLLSGIITSEEQILPGQRLVTTDLEKLNIVIKIMDTAKEMEISKIISEINFEDKNEYTLYVETQKKIIYIGDASNLTNKMLYVQAILEAEEGNEGEIFLNGNLNDGFQPFFREKV